MSTTTATPLLAVSTATTRPTTSLRRATVVVGLVAAAVTTAAAAALHAVGVSFAVDGDTIPVVGFAQLTFVGAVIGGVLLAVLNWRSTAPRRRFLQIAVVLTALSCVPSIAWPDDATTAVALVMLHLLAAAIIVLTLVRYAHD